MPQIGIVRGFGEGYNATYYIIKLIKALNKRFRSGIYFDEIPCGDYLEHGSTLSHSTLCELKKYDCIFIGDFKSQANPVEYSELDIATAMLATLEYTHVSGFGDASDIDSCIVSYFDGGAKMREVNKSADGCMETKVCSAFSISNAVKNVSRFCENRRRRLALVTDDSNEYCMDMFYNSFKSFVFPLSNFKLVKYTPRELCRDVLKDASIFDVIFSSCAFSEAVLGAFEFVLNDKFTYYKRYVGERNIYSINALQTNSACENYIPSLYSYIIAFCDMLKMEFNLEKEATWLRKAMEEAVSQGYTFEDAERFINSVIENLQQTVTTKFSKVTPIQKYIK